jgi:hypothetical protein
MKPQEKVKLLTGKELLTYYNEHSAAKIKRFSDRATAERRVAELMVIVDADKKTTKPKAAVETTEPAKPEGKAVIIKKDGGLGRPKMDFKIVVSEGTAKIQKASLRGRILRYMADNDASKQGIAVSALEAVFPDENVKGAVSKLANVKCVKRVDE